MDILRHRPLFLCCAAFIASAAVGFSLPLPGKWILAGLILAGVLLYACLWRGMRHQSRYRLPLGITAGLLACLALLQSHRYFHGESSTYLQTLAQEQESVRVKATVVDVRSTDGSLTTLSLELDTVNGRRANGLAMLTCYDTSPLRPGQRICLDATAISLEEAVGDGYDATALLGDGYVIGLATEDASTATVTGDHSRHPLVLAGSLRRSLSARLHWTAGQESEGLPSAMLLGDRSVLSDSLRRDFSRAGVSHLLAISGFHLTLLFGMLALILRWLAVPKRIRVVLLGMGVCGYLFLLGFPPSATRAAVMLCVTYLAYLTSSRADPLTSLGLAGALILAVTPYAVADAGFWMSFMATLGLITVMPLLQVWMNRPTEKQRNPWWTRLRRDLLYIASAVLVCLVAMSFTLFMVATVIGEISLLSPVSTLLLTPFCGLLLLLSLICLPVAGTPVGALLGSLMESVCALMADLVAGLGSPSLAVISLRHPAVRVLAAVMMAATLCLLVVRLSVKRRWMVIFPLIVGWVAVGGVLTGHALLTRDEIAVSYLEPSSVSESLVLVAGNQGVICDLSNGSLSALSASAREAKAQGATELNTLVLTHYHTRTSGALAKLLERETVRSLWMPRPEDEAEYYLLLACLEKAEAARVPVVLYDYGEALPIFGEGTLTVERTALARSSHPVLMVAVDLSPAETGKDELLYCGAAALESDLAPRVAAAAASSDIIIFGSHGPRIQQPYGEGLSWTASQEIVLSGHGDVGAWLFPSSLSDTIRLWQGPFRTILQAS